MSIPNYITLFRILIVPIFFGFLSYYNDNHPEFRNYALLLFLIAIASDALDGFIARHFNQKTELGVFLDPFADKLLLLSGFLGITFSSAFSIKPPLWIIILIVFRDLFIICGLVIIFLTTRHILVKPNLLGKLTTFFQMLTIFFVLAEGHYAAPIWYLAALLTLFSTLAYMLRGVRILNTPTSAL